MNALSAFALLLGLLLIVCNTVINIGSLSKIISHCYNTSSIRYYWKMVYQACFHRRSLYSSMVIFIIAFLLFIMLTPVIWIRSLFIRVTMGALYDSGANFNYYNIDLYNATFRYSNLEELGIQKFESTATGNIRRDFALAIGYIEEHCRKLDLKISHSNFASYDLDNKMKVLIPITIEANEKSYPMYLIYNQEHKTAYQKINPVLKDNHFQNALYLSTIPM